MIVLFLYVVIVHCTVKWPCGADGEKKNMYRSQMGKNTE